ncbi:MAG: ATP-binding protein [Lachnospiraceae bacterium]|nr:ATP-binding protein [Lachnospiraceae bacterium]
MYREVAKLILYGETDQTTILNSLADIFRKWESKESSKAELIRAIYTQVKRILIVATDYGFDTNLWHNYLTYLLITNENPFSITCEKIGANEGNVNHFAKNDFQAFLNLFHFDFGPIEQDLGIDAFSTISNYKAIVKKDLMYNKNVSEKVRGLSARLETAKDENEFFTYVTDFYKAYGVGMFGLNKAFRINTVNDQVVFQPINNMEMVVLDDLVGYEIQKQKLIENTESFVQGRKANNALLFGDSGTGKSTSIKAIVNQYYDQGLRMIEIYKHQFKQLSTVVAMIKNRNYKYIIYMDDLSFEEFEIEYKFLKAVIEGGVETKPDNILIYATSNRRHIIKETWKDRNDVNIDNGIHKSDNMEEKMSLVNRFGCQICYIKPDKKEFNHIVLELAKKNGLDIPEDKLLAEANKWEISHGGFSGRTAQQFINYMMG